MTTLFQHDKNLMMGYLQQNIYQHLIRITAEYVSWSTVEGASLSQLQFRLLKTEEKAKQLGLAPEAIRLALQLGELQGRFGM